MPRSNTYIGEWKFLKYGTLYTMLKFLGKINLRYKLLKCKNKTTAITYNPRRQDRNISKYVVNKL